MKQETHELGKQTIGKLQAMYSHIFNSRCPLPLKIGIASDLISVLPPNAIRTALRMWTGHRKYLHAVIAGGYRYDLTGHRCGVVAECDVRHSRLRLWDIWRNRDPDISDAYHVLNLTVPGMLMGEVESYVMMRALLRHPNAHKKTSRTFAGFRRHSRHFTPVIVYADGSEETFSLKKCFP